MKKLSIPISTTLELLVQYEQRPFDKGVVDLEMEKLSVASSEMIAYARTHCSAKSVMAQHPFWTAECQICVPGEGVFLVSREKNPILKDLRRAYLARTHGDDFPVDDASAEEIVRDARTNAVEAKETGVLKIPDEYFTSESFTRYVKQGNDVFSFLFGKYAVDYQNFLRKNNLAALAYTFLPINCSRTEIPTAFPVVLDNINFDFTIQTSLSLSSGLQYACSIVESAVQKPEGIIERILKRFK